MLGFLLSTQSFGYLLTNKHSIGDSKSVRGPGSKHIRQGNLYLLKKYCDKFQKYTVTVHAKKIVTIFKGKAHAKHFQK